MTKMFCQGDLLIERVKDVPASGEMLKAAGDGAVVLAEGETTGHRHAIHGGKAVMFRDDSLARDIERDLYLGHINVTGPGGADLVHEEHATITLPKGTYRVRRQREFDGWRAQVVAD